jgi:UDP-GlcNAc:undecaprenyl-phosphate GlcNAc-1-phosphate transferase
VIGTIGITNAFNLIDGVDGLTGGIVFINAFIFGVVFVIMKEWYFAILSFSMVGAYLGFLIFNFHPAKIFMGDCGSLVAGLLMCLLALHLLSLELDTILFHIGGKRVNHLL